MPALVSVTIDHGLSEDQCGLLLRAGGAGTIRVSGAMRRFFDLRAFAAAEQRQAQTVVPTSTGRPSATFPCQSASPTIGLPIAS